MFTWISKIIFSIAIFLGIISPTVSDKVNIADPTPSVIATKIQLLGNELLRNCPNKSCAVIKWGFNTNTAAETISTETDWQQIRVLDGGKEYQGWIYKPSIAGETKQPTYPNLNQPSKGNSVSTPQPKPIYYENEFRELSRDAAIEEYWDEIKDYMDGYESIEAFSYASGNYYNVEATISNGAITRISFPDGGYLYFYADIDSNGTAEEIDTVHGSAWSFQIDVGSAFVDDAIFNWADVNGYEIY